MCLVLQRLGYSTPERINFEHEPLKADRDMGRGSKEESTGGGIMEESDKGPGGV